MYRGPIGGHRGWLEGTDGARLWLMGAVGGHNRVYRGHRRRIGDIVGSIGAIGSLEGQGIYRGQLEGADEARVWLMGAVGGRTGIYRGSIGARGPIGAYGGPIGGYGGL